MSAKTLRRKLLRGTVRLLWPLFGLALRALFGSWRVRLVGSPQLLDEVVESGRPVVVALWHSDLVPCGVVLHRKLLTRGHPVTGLVSRSADGEIVARAAATFGFQTIRGSTSRGGLAALRDLYRILRGGQTIGIAPDGPRGPARIAKPGIVQAALLCGSPIVPMAAASGRAWTARSWDRTKLPKPFAEVVVAVGDELSLSRDADLESETLRLAAVLDELGARARSAAQLSDDGDDPK